MTDELYKDYFERIKGTEDASKVSSQMGLIETSPQEALKHHQMGQQLGLPSSVIELDPDQFEKNMRRQKATSILQSSPITAKWLVDLENQRIAREKIEELSAFEQYFGAVGRATGRSTRQMTAGSEASMAIGQAEQAPDIGLTFEDILTEERTRAGIEKMEAQGYAPFMVANAETRAADAAQRRYDFARRFEGQDQADVVRQAADRYASAQQMFQKANQIPMSEMAGSFRDETLANAEDTFLGTLGAFAADPVRGLVFIGETAAETLPTLIAATATTAVTGQPLAGAAVMGMGSGFRENANEAMGWVAENSEYDVTTPEGVAALLADDALLQEAEQRGLTRGLIIGAMDGLSGGLASATLAKTPLGDVLVQSFVQSFMGGGGEFLAQYALGDEISPKEIVIEALAELATLPIELGGVGGKPLIRQLARYGRSGNTQNVITELSEMAEQVSEIREAAPERFTELMSEVDQSNTYFQLPAAEVERFYQSEVSDEILNQLGVERTDYEASLRTGGEIQVPASNFVTNFANTEVAPLFEEHATIDNDEMSVAEARAYEALDGVTEDVQAAMEADAAQTVLGVSDEAQRLTEQIVEASLVTPNVSEREARVQGMTAGVLMERVAQRAGLSMEEYGQRYGLEVRGVSDIPPDDATSEGVLEQPAARPAPPTPEEVFSTPEAFEAEIEVELDDGAMETMKAGDIRDTLETRRNDANSLLECLLYG